MENEISWVTVFGSPDHTGQLGTGTNTKAPHINEKKTCA